MLHEIREGHLDDLLDYILEGLKKNNPAGNIGKTAQNIMYAFHRMMKQGKRDGLISIMPLFPEKEDCPAALLPKHEPKIGSTLWIIGSPQGIEHNVSKGIFSKKLIRITKQKKQFILYRTDADIFLGNSGGGAFDSSGRLVGIIKAMQRHVLCSKQYRTCRNIFVPGGGLIIGWPTIKQFIEKI